MNPETKEEIVIRRSRALLQKLMDMCRKSEKEPYRTPVTDAGLQISALRSALEDLDGAQDRKIPYKSEARKDYSREEIKEEHESFGLMRFNTVSGPVRLFGSHLDYHPSWIQLEIVRGCRIHDATLSYDSYFHGPGVYKDYHIATVAMSAAQFANIITNMNSGVGEPVTLREVRGVHMEPVPDEHVSENRKIKDLFSEKMKNAKGTVEPNVKKIHEILGKKSIGKADRTDISHALKMIVHDLTDGADWVLGQFDEASEKLMMEAKKEVEAYANALVHSLGIERLQQLQEASEQDVMKVIEGDVKDSE